MTGYLLRRTFAPCLFAAAALFSSERAAAAGHANGFGDKGELIITADRLVPVFNYTHMSVTDNQFGGPPTLSYSRSGGGMSLLWGHSFGLPMEDGNLAVNVHQLPRVAVDYAVIPHLTIGGALAFGFGFGGTDQRDVVRQGGVTSQRTDTPRPLAFGVAPRVGYVLPLSDIFAFWPRAGFGLYWYSEKRDIVDNNGAVRTRSDSDFIFSLDLDPQFALVPMEHFFFHFGPIVNIPLVGNRTSKEVSGATSRSVENDVSVFNFGISAGLGGWFNL